MLENPTRYHVIQKQKNQVRQYLSESFQQSEWSDHQDMQQLQQHHQSKQEVDHARHLFFSQKKFGNYHDIYGS